jgi:hypothetical protein
MKQGYLISGLGVALACVLAWELSSSRPEPEAGDQPRPTVAGVRPVAKSEVAAPEADLAAAARIALARPLFSRDRRPGEDQRQTAQTAPSNDVLPRLSGVIVGPHGHRALFTDATGRSLDATEGDAIGRYVIHGIQPGIVVLLGPEGERVLYTSYAKAAGTKEPGTQAAPR